MRSPLEPKSRTERRTYLRDSPGIRGDQGIGAITSLENELSTLFKLIEVTT